VQHQDLETLGHSSWCRFQIGQDSGWWLPIEQVGYMEEIELLLGIVYPRHTGWLQSSDLVCGLTTKEEDFFKGHSMAVVHGGARGFVQFRLQGVG